MSGRRVPMVVTARVKSALVDEPGLKGLEIAVETRDNVVIPGGWVESESLRQKSEAVARGVAGVRDVRNTLTVE